MTEDMNSCLCVCAEICRSQFNPQIFFPKLSLKFFRKWTFNTKIFALFQHFHGKQTILSILDTIYALFIPHQQYTGLLSCGQLCGPLPGIRSAVALSPRHPSKYNHRISLNNANGYICIIIIWTIALYRSLKHSYFQYFHS